MYNSNNCGREKGIIIIIVETLFQSRRHCHHGNSTIFCQFEFNVPMGPNFLGSEKSGPAINSTHFQCRYVSKYSQHFSDRSPNFCYYYLKKKKRVREAGKLSKLAILFRKFKNMTNVFIY